MDTLNYTTRDTLYRPYNPFDYNNVLMMSITTMMTATSTKVIGVIMSVIGIILVTCYQFLHNIYTKISKKNVKLFQLLSLT